MQQLFGYPPPAESWGQAPTERKVFLEWLSNQGSRVLFLSGDVHVSELYQAPLGAGRNAWELTSSGLANSSRYSPLFKMLERPERKWLVTQENFCVVDVDIPKGDVEQGSLRIRALAAKDGKVLQDTRASFATFRSEKKGERERRRFK